MKQIKILNFKKIKLNIKGKLYIKKFFDLKYIDLKHNFNNIENNTLNLKFNFYIDDLFNNANKNIFNTSYTSDYLNDSFYNSRFSQFESYLSILNLFDFSQISKNFEYKYKYTLLSKFIPFLIKNGKKLKTINSIFKASSNIYRALNCNNSLKEYAFLNEFKYYILTSKDTNNLNYLLNWIITIYKPVFDIKAFNVPKISKKKTDKTLLFKIVYLPDKNRLKIAFKHISLDIKKNNSNILNTRISNSFLDILLNYKKSYLYTRKMYIYEQVMEL